MQDKIAGSAVGRFQIAATARSAIDAFIVMDVMRQANALQAAGRDIIHMEVGQPATAAPRLAREAAKRAIDTDRLGYTEALGLPALRERISTHYRRWYGIEVPASRVVVTAGSSAGFVLSFLAAFSPGDRVALPSPGYPCYRHILKALGCEPVPLETTAETRWMPTPALLDRAAAGGPLKGLLIASPNNPTGTMVDADRLSRLVKHAAVKGIAFLSDEIYHGLTYAMPGATALAMSDETIVINSFSKYFSMTGWRVGWMVLPEALVRPVERLAQNLYIAPTTISQVAALAAFEAEDELESYKAVYVRNRELLLDALPGLGLSRLLPADGAFYIYADVSDWTDDSHALAGRLLDEAGVAVTPGVDFDAARGRQYWRLSYAGTTESMAEAVKRVRAWRG
ncbi:MAG: aminotransferase class I/II-fold pyridoxal phosphate-dependent enzyme [Hyphomicrobiaceae bacterium]